MILVTGGAGYIGSHFIKTWLEKQPTEKVVVVDNLTEGHKESLVSDERIILIQENIGDIPAMTSVFRNYDIKRVVHFAASCYVGESQQNPTKYFQNNVVNSLNLFKVMDEHDVKKILFSSSCATYGVPEKLPLDEMHPQNPINVYGLTKLMIEKALTAYAETSGWSYVALRYFNAAGADPSGLIGEHHEPETHLVPLVLQTALRQRGAIQIYGDDYETPDGTCIRDYIHVSDLAEAHCQAIDYLDQTKQVKEAINLGTTHGASIREIIDLCQSVTEKSITVEIARRRDGDPPVLVADYVKAKNLLGWQPAYNLESIIKTAWVWEQNRRY